MRTFKWIILTTLISLLFCSPSSYAYTHVIMNPVTWKGKKWEYLVEHPTQVRHVDPSLFEEVLDSAGQNGWRLIAVTSDYHFFTFYFERPLLPHKVDSHRARLKTIKQKRANTEAALRHKIEKATLIPAGQSHPALIEHLKQQETQKQNQQQPLTTPSATPQGKTAPTNIQKNTTNGTTTNQQTQKEPVVISVKTKKKSLFQKIFH